ncbi:MAG: translocation/assembly module TamB domain-containing protein, partial [Myxococcota bacterium]
TARLHRVSLPHILAIAGVPDAWVRLSYSGDVHATGRVNPLKLQLDLGGTIAAFEVLDRTFRDPEAVQFLKLDSTDIVGPATLTTRGVRLGGVEVRRGETVLSVEGELAFDPDAGLDLRVAGEHFDFAEIGPVASIPFEGVGPVAATIEGPYSNLTISGTAELDQFSVYGYYVGDTKATVIFSDMDLTIARASIRRGPGAITGAVTFRFGDGKPTIKGSLHLTNVDTDDLLLTAGLEPALAQRFASPVSGTVNVSGPLAFPTGSATLHAPRLQIDGVAVGKAHLELGFGGKPELIWGELDLTPETGSLKGRVALLAEKELEIRANARGISLGLLTPFIGDPPITGTLTGKAVLRGPADALSGEYAATVLDLTAWGLRLEKTEVTGSLLDGEMTVLGTALTGDSDVTATLKIGRTIPFTVTAKVDRLDLDRVFPLGDSTGVTVSGTFFSQGDLTAPDTLMADVQLATATVLWKEFHLQSVRAVRIQYAKGSFNIDDLTLAGPGTQIGVGGTVAVNGELNLRVIGRTDLRSAGSPGGDLHWQRGTLELDTRVGGTLKSPELFGEASIRDASLRVASGAGVVDTISAKVEFAGRSVHLNSGVATVGGGNVRFAGQMLLPADDKPQLDVSVDLESITIRPYPDLHTRLSGNLNIAGPLGDLLVKGQIDLESLRYSVNVDLKSLIPRRHAPLKVPAFDPGQTVALAVAVKAPNNLFISNNVIEAEFQADLLLTGTTERLGLIGSITPLWGRAHYRDNVFNIERASIDFTEEFRIFTRFDIHATADACGMKVSVDIHGNSDSYNVVPSGQDETGGFIDSQDLFACLQFGMRMAEFQERVGREDTQDLAADPLGRLSGSPLASGLDAFWAVSGMDEKIRRLLPIQLDEVRLESGWSSQFKRTTMRIVVGKDLGEDFKLKYTSSLDEVNDQSVSVQYRLSDKAMLQGTWLSASDVPIGDLGLDLRLRWEFR